MYGYIYITTNLVNGKKYIGKHKSNSFDLSYKGSGVALRKAMNKYGRDAFHCELVESFDTREELNDAEIRYITKYDAVNSLDFYNIASGGEGGDTFNNLSEKDKEKFRENTRNRWKSSNLKDKVSAAVKAKWEDNNYRKIASAKISKNLKGIPKSESHKKKLSRIRLEKGLSKGKNNPMYGKNRSGELAPNYGRHYYNNGEVEFLLYEEVYENEYKDKGFIKGRLQSKLDALHKDLSKRLQGNTYNKGKIRIHKDNLEKLIKPEDLQNYINEGWIKGRRPKQVN